MLDFDGTRKVRQREAAFSAGILLFALILFILPDQYQAPIREAIRSTVLRPFLSGQAALAGRRAMSVDVTQLRAQRDSLVAVVAASGTLAEENRRLRDLQGLRARAKASFTTAEVIRLGVGPAESTFMISAGKAEGVLPNSPVIAPEGLIGIVVEVDEHRAIVRAWTHPDFRVSGMTADGEAMGMVVSRRGDFREEDQLALTGAPFHTDIQPGRAIVTTGKGGIYPRGMPIGIVIGIEEADTGWRKSYLLRPTVRPEAVTHVMVGVGDQSSADYSELWQVAAQQQVVILPPPDTSRAAPPTRRTPAVRRDTTARRDTTPVVPPPTTTTGNF